jgi:uncharacterized protein (TIGR03437 family)
MSILRIAFGLFLCVAMSTAQPYVISTLAGGTPPATPGAALNASIGSPAGLATDSRGNVYFTSINCVFKVDLNGVITRIAGNSRPGYSGDGGPASGAQLFTPRGLTVDGSGNLFIADWFNNRVRKVSPDGIISTVAGTGVRGLGGDGGPAADAQLTYPAALATDAAGNLFIADYFRILKVSTNGIVTTVAGSGSSGFAGDGGPAIDAEFSYPSGIAVDGSGNLYIADSNNFRIRAIAPNGIITTMAGTGVNGYSGDGGAATNAQLNYPYGVAMDKSGNLIIADSGNARIRSISPDGIISTVAGTGVPGFSGDGGPALNAQIYSPDAVIADGSGNLFVADTNNKCIRKVVLGGIITTVAGNGTPGFSGDGAPATGAQLASPWGVAADGLGNVFFADAMANRIRKVAADGTITTVAGTGVAGFSGDGGPAVKAQLFVPYGGVVADGSGNLYITDWGNACIRKISSDGIINTIAGNGGVGFSGDGGPAVDAELDGPNGIAIDASGNLFIADFHNSRIRKVSANGIITTVAGNGTQGFSGDGGPALNAQLFQPNSVAVDASGNIFIADQVNNRIRMVSTHGIISTVAGNGSLGDPDGDGDNGPATSASLTSPAFVAVDGAGNLFILDGQYSNRVRKVSANGVITAVAGTGTPGYSGDGGPATSAQMYVDMALAVDGAGDIFITDEEGYAIRKLTPAGETVLIGAIMDAASESATPVSPGKAVVVYGAGLGPAVGVTAAPANGAFGTQLEGTMVLFNGIAAPVYYASETQVNAIVPYEIIGATANVTVVSHGGVSTGFVVPVAASSPGLFSYNATGAGQAAAINAVDGTLNTASNPVKIGAYISLYATGEGQTTPAGVDGKLATLPLPSPNLPVAVTVGGVPAVVEYKGGVPGAVAGLMQVNVQIPAGVTPGGYVPVVLTVGNASTVNGASWIAVSN